MLGEAEFCPAAKLPKDYPWFHGFHFPHMWEEGVSPVIPKGPAAWTLCDGGWVNGYWPQASPEARAQSLVLANPQGFRQKASSYNYWQAPCAWKSKNILPDLSVQHHNGFSFLDIHYSWVCNGEKLETTVNVQ